MKAYDRCASRDCPFLFRLDAPPEESRRPLHQGRSERKRLGNEEGAGCLGRPHERRRGGKPDADKPDPRAPSAPRRRMYRVPCPVRSWAHSTGGTTASTIHAEAVRRAGNGFATKRRIGALLSLAASPGMSQEAASPQAKRSLQDQIVELIDERCHEEWLSIHRYGESALTYAHAH